MYGPYQTFITFPASCIWKPIVFVMVLVPEMNSFHFRGNYVCCLSVPKVWERLENVAPCTKVDLMWTWLYNNKKNNFSSLLETHLLKSLPFGLESINGTLELDCKYCNQLIDASCYLNNFAMISTIRPANERQQIRSVSSCNKLSGDTVNFQFDA